SAALPPLPLPRTANSISAPSPRLAAGRVERHGERRDVAFGLGNLRRAFLRDLVDADHGMHGNEAALDPVELGLELLLGGIDDDFAALAENQPGNLEEAEQP